MDYADQLFSVKCSVLGGNVAVVREGRVGTLLSMLPACFDAEMLETMKEI